MTNRSNEKVEEMMASLDQRMALAVARALMAMMPPPRPLPPADDDGGDDDAEPSA